MITIRKQRTPEWFYGHQVEGRWHAHCGLHGTINYFTSWRQAMKTSFYHFRSFHGAIA